MYLYVAFFKENDFSRRSFSLTGQYLEKVTTTFPNFLELDGAQIEGCIGFLKGKDNSNKACFALNVSNIKVDGTALFFNFTVDKELDITNEAIDKSLYKYARQANWINNENKYYPIVCILNKADFDIIRKGSPNLRKATNKSAKLDELRQVSNWIGICDMFEPLELLHQKVDVWTNTHELYDVSYACSKIGEPQNGLERDRSHLVKVKRYRELSIALYKRCCELEPENFRFPSALGYRYRLNVMELTKPKGRRDGKVADEINEAIMWLDKALELNPQSIKDNYRKGTLILDYQIDNFQYTPKKWTKETFHELEEMERTAIECLKSVIKLYEEITSEQFKKLYANEYVKALYAIGCYNIGKPKVFWNEYACCKLQQIGFSNNLNYSDLNYIVAAKEMFERCFKAESDISLEEDFDYRQFVHVGNNWAESPMDKLYRLGLVYLHMYFTKKLYDNDDEKVKLYGKKAEKYLVIARAIGEELRRMRIGGRHTGFISEKLSWYYIFSGDYSRAVQLLERSRDSYAKNTYAIALLLSTLPDKFERAEPALKTAVADGYNKAQDISIALLAHLYKLKGDNEQLQLVLSKRETIRSSGNRLIALIDKDSVV